MLDMTDSIAPKSDQMNADDLMSGPRTFTIAEVRKAASPDQPVDVFLAEFPAGRPFKPSKSMRRVMVAAWGPDASTYAGKRMTLYRDPAVRFGGQDVGGIRISAVSDIKAPLTLALTVTRGKRAPYKVDVLPAVAPAPNLRTEAQSKQLAALMRDNDMTDRDEALAWMSGLLGRDVKSTKELTQDEAGHVIAALTAQQNTAEVTA